MSIYRNDDFCFLDELALWREMGPIVPRREFYQIREQFKMDSAVNKTPNSEVVKKRKKRPRTQGGASFLQNSSNKVKKVFEKFVQLRTDLLLSSSTGTSASTSTNTDNNLTARQAAASLPDFGFLDRVRNLATDAIECKTATGDLDLSKLTLFQGDPEQESTAEIDGFRFLIPAESQFVFGPVAAIKHFDFENRQFDEIILDPPWPNKSVKRLRTYDTFEIEELFDLPVEDLLAPGGCVIVWLSNNGTVHASVDRILETWGLERVATWHWLKLTQAGEPVVPFDSHHKVPFESFVIAARAPDVSALRTAGCTEDFCLLSVPSSSHSRKPPVGFVLERLVDRKPNATRLELFARYLQPHTVSVGFEVLKFQHTPSAVTFCDR